jgi:hypothetical protein
MQFFSIWNATESYLNRFLTFSPLKMTAHAVLLFCAGALIVAPISYLVHHKRTNFASENREEPTTMANIVAPALQENATYWAARDAIDHMHDSPPCRALAHTMLSYASDFTLPQHVRDAQVYRVMQKATQYCM